MYQHTYSEFNTHTVSYIVVLWKDINGNTDTVSYIVVLWKDINGNRDTVSLRREKWYMQLKHENLCPSPYCSVEW